MPVPDAVRFDHLSPKFDVVDVVSVTTDHDVALTVGVGAPDQEIYAQSSDQGVGVISSIESIIAISSIQRICMFLAKDRVVSAVSQKMIGPVVTIEEVIAAHAVKIVCKGRGNVHGIFEDAAAKKIVPLQLSSQERGVVITRRGESCCGHRRRQEVQFGQRKIICVAGDRIVLDGTRSEIHILGNSIFAVINEGLRRYGKFEVSALIGVCPEIPIVGRELTRAESDAGVLKEDALRANSNPRK